MVGSVEVHPAGSTPHVWYAAVEMRTLTLCGGVPISIVNEDHGPSLPSLCVVSFLEEKEVGMSYQSLDDGTTTGAGPLGGGDT